jgi:hypothetical protein
VRSEESGVRRGKMICNNTFDEVAIIAIPAKADIRALDNCLKSYCFSLLLLTPHSSLLTN